MTPRKEIIGDCELWLGDCREVLPALQKYDACITDPPYGIGEAAGKNKRRGHLAAAKDYGNDQWDDAPVDAALLALVRASAKWLIVFGGNFYDCAPRPTCRCPEASA